VSVLELVLVILLLAVLVGLVAVVIRRPSATGPSDAVLAALADLGSLKSHVETVSNQQGALSQSLGMLQAAVQGVETKVLESSAGVREAIGKDLSDARIVVERLKVDGEERRRMEEDVQASARRIETVLLGSRTRGAAGENILQDAFRQFPAEMIDMNFRVNGKVVEYALILANGKRLPIDSKWPSPELLDRLGEAMQDPAKEAALVQEIERIMRLKVRDVRQYIDPAATIGFAHTLGEFGVVLMIGGNIPGRTRVLSIAIYDHVERLEYAAAHRLSLGMLLFSFLALWAVYALNVREPREPRELPGPRGPLGLTRRSRRTRLPNWPSPPPQGEP